MCNCVTIVFLNQCLQKENQDREASVGSVPGLVTLLHKHMVFIAPWAEHDYFLHHTETNQEGCYGA